MALVDRNGGKPVGWGVQRFGRIGIGRTGLGRWRQPRGGGPHPASRPRRRRGAGGWGPDGPAGRRPRGRKPRRRAPRGRGWLRRRGVTGRGLVRKPTVPRERRWFTDLWRRLWLQRRLRSGCSPVRPQPVGGPGRSELLHHRLPAIRVPRWLRLPGGFRSRRAFLPAVCLARTRGSRARPVLRMRPRLRLHADRWRSDRPGLSRRALRRHPVRPGHRPGLPRRPCLRAEGRRNRVHRLHRRKSPG